MPNADIRKPQARELPIDLRRRLTELIAARGLRVLADDMGVHAQTLATLAAGVRARRSTVAYVTRLLVEIEARRGE